MRKSLFTLIGLVGAGIAALSVRSATATDDHAGHDVADIAAAGGAESRQQQPSATPGSGAQAAERIAASPRRSEWVMIRVGPTDSVVAYVVYPQRTEKAPVVIALHENTGLNVWTRNVADQLAAEGFIGIAPDMTTMWRTGDLRSDPTQDQGRAGIQGITAEQVQRNLDAVAQYAMALPEAQPRYGIVGFCWGGLRVFEHAVHAPNLGAAVVYYGMSPPSDRLATVRAPVLGLYAGDDARINNSIPGADSTMKRLEKSYEHHIFPGAGHGFLRQQEGREGANLRASQESWPRAVAFFRQHLGT